MCGKWKQIWNKFWNLSLPFLHSNFFQNFSSITRLPFCVKNIVVLHTSLQVVQFPFKFSWLRLCLFFAFLTTFSFDSTPSVLANNFISTFFTMSSTDVLKWSQEAFSLFLLSSRWITATVIFFLFCLCFTFHPFLLNC